ncbi:MAG: nitrous oxide reductase family maturation protein NosD [Candidatus Hermodarchaeota archaeon]
MGEQTGTRLNHRSAACKFPSESIRKKQLLRPRRIFMAVSLTLILTTTGLVYYWMLLPPIIFIPPPLTPHAAIAIDGDANFSDTALLEEWPGNGTPEYPYIIDGLNISEVYGRHCIAINNTQVSFTISNCSFHTLYAGISWEAGIYLENVTNGEIVHNTFSDNDDGIYLIRSDSNTVSDNKCTDNGFGIHLIDSDSNTLTNNTCTDNNSGIHLIDSDSNTVANNTCNINEYGISIDGPEQSAIIHPHDESRSSHSNIIANNTCNFNGIGIYLYESISNIVEDNTCLGNTEHDVFDESELGELAHRELLPIQYVWFIADFGIILVVSVIAFVQCRRMKM